MNKQVELIKTEIEKRLDTLYDELPDGNKAIYVGVTASEANITGKYTALESLLDYINSLQEEPVIEDLEEEIELQIRNLQGVHAIENGQNWWHGTYDDLREFARYFAEHSVYGSQAEDLEKAAEEYDGTMYLSDAFIAGANWQKEQMTKDATKIEVKIDAGGYPYIPQIELYDYSKDIPLAKEGDKVKVIVIKED